MNLKLLMNDFKRNKLIVTVLILFVLLASMLVSSAFRIITELSGSLNHLFKESSAPDFIQKHVGDFDQSEIDRFIQNNPLVKASQTCMLINIDGADIVLGDGTVSESGSVMDNGFTTQNHKMDFLLNLNNEKIEVSDGEIAVAVYHMEQRGLTLGDKVTISNGEVTMEFTITDFLRDAVNNPSVLNAKRFLVSSQDFDLLCKSFATRDNLEYMIEFQLTDKSQIDAFASAYQSAGLYQAGPAATISLLKLMNGISDGLIAGVAISVSILLVIVSMLCLRFTILTTMEEDYREIGVVKAIGLGIKDIKQIYLVKYMGIGQTDIRIDLQHISQINERFSMIQSRLSEDQEIKRYAGFITSSFNVYDSSGEAQSVYVESGDFSIFPLKYLKGTAPQGENQIALSSLNADALGITIG